MSPQPPAATLNISVTTPPEEAQLDWYREDPLANDHHHHWHVVYPRGIPSERFPRPRRTQPRQGELFLYMHQQMLARYDTERRIAGLESCATARPTTGTRSPRVTMLQEYGPRPVGRAPTNLEAVTRVEEGFAEVKKALEEGQIEAANGDRSTARHQPARVRAGVIGLVLQPGAPMTWLWYRNFHGTGHGMIASASDQVGFGGPMAYVETAIRDPVFYRWHRHIDDFSYEYQNSLGARDLGEHAADVVFRKDGYFTPDLALCLMDEIEGAETPGFDFANWGRENLGADLELEGPTTDELLTEFIRSDLTLGHIPG